MSSRSFNKAAIISVCIASLPVASFATAELKEGYLRFGMGQLKTPHSEPLQIYSSYAPYKIETLNSAPGPVKFSPYEWLYHPTHGYENSFSMTQRSYDPLVVRPVSVSAVIPPAVNTPAATAPFVTMWTTTSPVAPPPVVTPPVITPQVVAPQTITPSVVTPPVVTPPVVTPPVVTPPVVTPPVTIAPTVTSPIATVPVVSLPIPAIIGKPAQAPEIDPASAFAALTMLFGTIAVLRGRR